MDEQTIDVATAAEIIHAEAQRLVNLACDAGWVNQARRMWPRCATDISHTRAATEDIIADIYSRCPMTDVIRDSVKGHLNQIVDAVLA